METKYMAKASLIAAVYVVLTVLLGEFSYGPIQFRVSEALAILPLVEPSAILGITIGCAISNIFGGFGPIDIIGGSLVTLTAAIITSKMPNKMLAALPPIILNSLIVSIWVSKMSGLPYIPIVFNILIGEIIAVGVLGLIFLSAYEKYVKKSQ